MRRRGFILTVGAAAILSGLAMAALSRAQSPVAKTSRADRTELRARVVKLRGEVEWLELERDTLTDRSEISMLSKSNREKVEAVEIEAGAMTDPAAMAAGFGVEKEKVGAWYEEELKKRGIKKHPGEDAYAALRRAFTEESEAYVKENGIDQRPGETAGAAILRATLQKQCGASLDVLDRIKQDFLRRSTNLNEKRLDLAEAERQYNESR